MRLSAWILGGLWLARALAASEFSDNFDAAEASGGHAEKIQYYSRAIATWSEDDGRPRLCRAYYSRGFEHGALGIPFGQYQGEEEIHHLELAIRDYREAHSRGCCDDCSGKIAGLQREIEIARQPRGTRAANPGLGTIYGNPASAGGASRANAPRIPVRDNNFTRAKRMSAAYRAGNFDECRNLRKLWWNSPPDSEGNLRSLLKEIDSEAHRHFLKSGG